jgi:hypothetical protein
MWPLDGFEFETPDLTEYDFTFEFDYKDHGNNEKGTKYVLLCFKDVFISGLPGPKKAKFGHKQFQKRPNLPK